MQTKIPTQKIVSKLAPLYTKHYTTWGTRKGGDETFRLLLKDAQPKLVPYYDYLRTHVVQGRAWKNALLGKQRLHYTCSLCTGSMCGTKPICSDECVTEAIHKIVYKKKPDWLLNDIKRDKSGNIARVNVTCVHCKHTKDEHLCYFLEGYGCNCQTGKKISTALFDKYGPKAYLKNLKDNNVNVKLLTPYVHQGIYIKFKCLDCGSINESLPQNILRSRGCYTCGQRKIVENCRAKHGVDYHCQRPEVIEQRRATMVEKYGSEYALQNKELFEKMLKSSYCRTEYKLGKWLVRVQGAEPRALDWLLSNTTIKASQIRCGSDDEVPTIKYTYRGKERNYFPDIYVPSRNLIIEVKSTYTYSVARKQNEAKRKAAKVAGYKFVFLMFNADGTRCHDYKTN